MLTVVESECKVLFTTKTIGRFDNGELLSQLKAEGQGPRVIILRGDLEGFPSFEETLLRGSKVSSAELCRAESRVLPHLVCNLQFTSGTTGLPKAAMLTHQYALADLRSINSC